MSDTDWRNRIIEMVEVDPAAILDHPFQFRTHPDTQRSALTDLLKAIGQVDTLLIYRSERANGQFVSIDGHLRKSTGGKWPALVLDVNDVEADLILATFDPLTAMAGTEAAKLQELLAGVNSDSPAVQAMLAGLAQQAGLNQKESAADPGAQVDRAGELQKKWQVKTGDLWIIGNHRLLCGDSTNADCVARVMGDDRYRMIWTDPPLWRELRLTRR